jgi:hypothetical protein
MPSTLLCGRTISKSTCGRRSTASTPSCECRHPETPERPEDFRGMTRSKDGATEGSRWADCCYIIRIACQSDAPTSEAKVINCHTIQFSDKGIQSSVSKMRESRQGIQRDNKIFGFTLSIISLPTQTIRAPSRPHPSQFPRHPRSFATLSTRSTWSS